jgi:predicted nuclease with TOPRIM domain
VLLAVILVVAATPSNTSTELVIALIALAGTLSLTVGGIIQALITRQRKAEEHRVRRTKDSNIETKFEEVDSQTDLLLTRIGYLDRENNTLRERIASLEGRSSEQGEELRYRNDKIDQLTREIAVWQYKWDQLKDGRTGLSDS